VADPLHPSDGIRLLLERLEVEPGDAAARYRAVIYTPDERHAYAARLVEDGGVELTADGAAAPKALEDKLRVHARTVARAAAQKRRDGLPPWPQRVLRWRPVRGGDA
jgi:hypothetical protein